MTISAVDRVRLAAMLGMLGSNHAGERENAARAVERFRRQRGLTWADLLERPPPEGRASEPPRDATAMHELSHGGVGYRVQDLVWRWSMLAGLGAVGLMSLSSPARHQAVEKPEAAGLERSPPADAVKSKPAAYMLGLADRRLYETWQQTAQAGFCSGRAAERKTSSSDCGMSRKLLAKFEERRRTDPLYRAGWNSLPP